MAPRTTPSHVCLPDVEHTTILAAIGLRLAAMNKDVTAARKARPDGRAEALAVLWTQLDAAAQELGEALAEVACIHQEPAVGEGVL